MPSKSSQAPAVCSLMQLRRFERWTGDFSSAGCSVIPAWGFDPPRSPSPLGLSGLGAWGLPVLRRPLPLDHCQRFATASENGGYFCGITRYTVTKIKPLSSFWYWNHHSSRSGGAKSGLFSAWIRNSGALRCSQGYFIRNGGSEVLFFL